MSSLKLTASAGLATAAGLLIALGAVVADDGANARSGISPPVVYPLPTADPPRPGMPVSPPPPPMFDGVTSNLFRWFPGRITIQTAGGICVTAEDPTVVRVVAREAEYHLDWQSRWWFGKSLPGNPSRAFGIEVKPDATAPAGSTAFRFDDRGLNESRTTLYGSLEPILLDLLPRELTRAVVAAHLGPDAPQWAVRGIVTLAESVGAQAVRDGYCRQSLNAGSGVRLKAFFNRTGGPQDDPVSNAQAHSVTRFLLTRNATGGEAAASSTPVGSDLSQIHADRRKRFLACVQAGPKDGWELAVKDAYGFPSLDQLEEAWIAWLRTPAAHPTLAPVPKPSPPVPEPARIPAVDVSAGRKP